MDLPRNYLVRIYRDTPQEFVGQVEIVATGDVLNFRSMQELCKVLVRSNRPRRGCRLTLSNEENKS